MDSSTTSMTPDMPTDKNLIEWSCKYTPPTGISPDTTEFYYQLFDDRLEYSTIQYNALAKFLFGAGAVIMIVFLTFGLGLGPVASFLGLCAGKLIYSALILNTGPIAIARADIRSLQLSEDHRQLNLTLHDDSQILIHTDPDIYPTLTELLIAQGCTVHGEMIAASANHNDKIADAAPQPHKRTIIIGLVVVWIGAAVVFSQIDGDSVASSHIALESPTSDDASSVSNELFQMEKAINADDRNYLAEKVPNVKALYANDGAFAAIKNDGSLITWGFSFQGANSSPQVQALHNIKSVLPFNGGLHGMLEQLGFFALTEDDRLVTWGETQAPAELEPRLTEVKEVLTTRRMYGFASAFSMIAVLKNDGSVVSWAPPQEKDSNVGQANSLTDIQSITTSYGCFIALDKQGATHVWGYSTCESDLAPKLSKRAYKRIRAYGDQILAETLDDTVLVISNRAETQPRYVLPQWAANISEFYAGHRTNAALLTDGTLMYWQQPTASDPKPRAYKQLDQVQQVQAVGVYTEPDIGWTDLLALTADGEVVNIDESESASERFFENCNNFSQIQKIIPLPNQQHVMLYDRNESIYFCGDAPLALRSYNGTVIPLLQSTELFLQSYMYLTQGSGQVSVLMTMTDADYDNYAKFFAENMQNSQTQIISNGSLLSLNQDQTLSALTPQDKPALKNIGKVRQALANTTGFAVLDDNGTLHTWRTTGYMDDEFISVPKEEL